VYGLPEGRRFGRGFLHDDRVCETLSGFGFNSGKFFPSGVLFVGIRYKRSYKVFPEPVQEEMEGRKRIKSQRISL